MFTIRLFEALIESSPDVYIGVSVGKWGHPTSICFCSLERNQYLTQGLPCPAVKFQPHETGPFPPNDRSTTRHFPQGAWWKRWWSAWEKAPAPAESASASSDPRKNRRTSSSEPSHILPHCARIMSQPIWIPNGLNGELIPWCCYSRVTGITAKKAADPNQSLGTYDLHQHSTKVVKSKLILASLASWWILYTSIICIYIYMYVYHSLTST